MNTAAAATADKFGCTSARPQTFINPGPGQGFTISQGAGPNAGLFYVTNPMTRMDLRSQLAKRYRSDDAKVAVAGISAVVDACAARYAPDPSPSQNNHGVNTECFQTQGFADLVAFAWPHEAEHLALAQEEAAKPSNDIYAQWEPIVRTSSSEARQDVNEIQMDMENAVIQHAASSHIGTQTSWEMWLHAGAGVWEWSTVTVRH